MNFYSRIKRCPLAFEIMLVVSMVLLFFDLAVLSPVTEKHYLTTACTILLIAGNCLFLFLLIATILNSIKNRDFIASKAVFILLFLYAVTKIFYLDTLPRWDGAWYFCRLLESVENFNFTLENFLKGFNWYGHPSMGYAFLMSFSQFLEPGNHCLLYLENFILAVASILLFYKFLIYLYKENNIQEAEIILLTALFAFNPLYFGLSLSFGLDFPILVFLVASFCALLYNRMILFAFFGTLLVFSKETGAFLYAAFLGATLFCYLINSSFSLEKWPQSLDITGLI